jgi:hypothetical protein
VCNPWPGRGVILVTVSGNLFPQDSPVTAAEGWSRMYRLSVCCRMPSGCLWTSPRGATSSSRLLSLHIFLCPGDTPIVPYDGQSVLDDLVSLALVPMFLAWRPSTLCRSIGEGPC